MKESIKELEDMMIRLNDKMHEIQGILDIEKKRIKELEDKIGHVDNTN